MNKILHPIKALEKWALERLLKRVVSELPAAQDKLLEVWKAHEDEIYKKVCDNIQKTIYDIVKKDLGNNAGNS